LALRYFWFGGADLKNLVNQTKSNQRLNKRNRAQGELSG